MIKHRAGMCAISTGIVVFMAAAQPAMSQPADGSTVAASNAATAKQLDKAQKKADRKARRAKKNAELGQLEKNGYNPQGDRVDYPQDMQNAQKKADAQKAGTAKPASTP